MLEELAILTITFSAVFLITVLVVFLALAFIARVRRDLFSGDE